MFGKKTECKKFFTYKSNTIDISGLASSLGSDKINNFDLKVGQFKISPEFVKVSEKLMELDMQQYDLCNTIKNISDRKKRDEMFIKLSEIKMQMFKIYKNLDEEKQNDKKKEIISMSKIDKIAVNGNDNIILQYVNGSNITINIKQPSDMQYFLDIFKDHLSEIKALIEYMRTNDKTINDFSQLIANPISITSQFTEQMRNLLVNGDKTGFVLEKLEHYFKANNDQKNRKIILMLLTTFNPLKSKLIADIELNENEKNQVKKINFNLLSVLDDIDLNINN